jgi:hypothetical protein
MSSARLMRAIVPPQRATRQRGNFCVPTDPATLRNRGNSTMDVAAGQTKRAPLPADPAAPLQLMR